jgi:AraC-like DNA-binding protein
LTFQKLFPADAAKWLIEEVEKRGVDAAGIMRGTGLDAGWLNDKDALLNAEQYSRLVMNALNESRDPTLGLAPIHQLNYLSRFGFWGYAILSSTYFGQASQMAIRYWDICGSLMRMSFQDEGDTCMWEFEPALKIDHEEMYVFAIEKVISSSFATIQFATGSPPPVREIHVTYSRPEHAFLYRDYWGAEVLFRQEKDLVRMDASVLKRPVLLGNPQIREVCQQQCRQLLYNLKRTDELVEVIRRIIIGSPGNFPDAKETAKKLGMSPRTLRRHLQERNTSYRKLLDEVRAELATGYLTTTSLGIDEIADLLDYAETTAFRRSFKKWVGKSAAAVRKAGGTGLLKSS